MPLTRRLVTSAHRVFTSTRAQVQSLTLHLPEPPSENHYYTVARGRKILSKQGRAYKLAVQAIYAREFRTVMAAFPEGPVALLYIWTRGRKSGDLTNRAKALCDALNGLAYRDDSQIVETHAYRRDAKNQPGVTVTVRRATPTED